MAISRTRTVRGFSLVELMVAMGLSILLLAGVLTMFVSSRSTYETNDRLARIEENGRFALNALVRDIRSAGYLGCSRNAGVNSTLNSKTNVLWDYESYSLAGFNYKSTGVWEPALDTTAVPSAADGSDVLVVRIPKSGTPPLLLTAPMALPTDTISVTAYPKGSTGAFQVPQILMIANCTNRSIFEATGYDAEKGIISHDKSAATGTTPGNATGDLGYTFTRSTALTALETVVYYVRKGENGNSLWRRVGTAPSEELIEGIDSMQLRFGMDTDGDRVVNEYVTADKVTAANMKNILAVSVALLVRTLDEYGRTVDKGSYQLLDYTFDGPGDRRMRKVFTTTVAIRNLAM